MDAVEAERVRTVHLVREQLDRPQVGVVGPVELPQPSWS